MNAKAKWMFSIHRSKQYLSTTFRFKAYAFNRITIFDCRNLYYLVLCVLVLRANVCIRLNKAYIIQLVDVYGFSSTTVICQNNHFIHSFQTNIRAKLIFRRFNVNTNFNNISLPFWGLRQKFDETQSQTTIAIVCWYQSNSVICINQKRIILYRYVRDYRINKYYSILSENYS